MKGPYERLKYDLRRTWECPVCRRKERTAGNVTYCYCSCQAPDGATLGGETVVQITDQDILRDENTPKTDVARGVHGTNDPQDPPATNWSSSLSPTCWPQPGLTPMKLIDEGHRRTHCHE